MVVCVMSRARDNSPLAKAAEKQGFRVRRTRKGWVVYARDGVRTVGFHRMPTCHRAKDNAIADLRRIGVRV